MGSNLSFKAVSRLVASALLVLGVSAPPVSAHHGGGTFSADRCFKFTGSVRQVAWANPHAWLYVNVDKGKGKTELWGFEFGSIAGLSRAGFRPKDFAVGTKVKVQAYANRDATKHTGSVSGLVLPDGRDVRGGPIAGTAPAGGAQATKCPEYK